MERRKDEERLEHEKELKRLSEEHGNNYENHNR
jgi:hypothetical protein